MDTDINNSSTPTTNTLNVDNPESIVGDNFKPLKRRSIDNFKYIDFNEWLSRNRINIEYTKKQQE